MSQFSGRDGVFKISGSAVAEMRGFEVTVTAILDEGAQMGDAWNRQNKIAMEFAGSCNFREFPGNSTQRLMVAGAELAMEAYPVGESSGRLKLSGTVIIAERSYPSELNSSVESNCTFSGQGALTEEVIA